MSTVVPNGQIRFFSDIRLDDNYENSINFETRESQTNYFTGLTPVHVMTGATRVREGVISVNALSDVLLNCNYMMFQNTGFSNKWFYAFIHNVEYVNNNMSYVYYTIDDMQTWGLFDVTLEQCFIEREHTRTDGLFEHLIPEGMGSNEYVRGTQLTQNLFGNSQNGGMDIILLASEYLDYEEDPDTHELVPTKYDAKVMRSNGMVSGLDIKGEKVINYDGSTDGQSLANLNKYIADMTKEQAKDSILTLFCFPHHLVNHNAGTDTPANPITALMPTVWTGALPTFNGYVPRNNKMYNSPYVLITITTFDGQVLVLQPEYFDANEGIREYDILPNVSANPSITIVVKNYKNLVHNYEKSLTIDSFPQIAWNNDGYSAWVASGGLEKINNQTSSNILSSITNVGVSALEGGLAGAAIGSIGGPIGAAGGLAAGVIGGGVKAGINIGKSIQDEMTVEKYAKTLPNEIHGTSNPTPFFTNNDMKIVSSIETVNSDIAKSIDDYFTMFGYKVNKLGVPNRHNRSKFTYIKTKGAKVHGTAPADAIARIQEIYNTGIRFWVNASEIGDYTVTNTPLGN